MANALAMLSFDTATRYLLVDDVGAWKAGQLGPLEQALAELPPDTVLVLVARGKPVKQLAKAVEKAGGETASTPRRSRGSCRSGASGTPASWGSSSTPRRRRSWWRASGTSQQRLSRELEKIALALHPP